MTRLVLVLLVSTAAAAGARTVRVHPGESIQAAVDAARPGTRIVVEPGTYTESGGTRAVTITKDGIQLVGRSRPGRRVILQQTGTQVHGVWASPDDSLDPADDELPPCGVSGRRLQAFTLQGITIQGFGGFGAYLACVDGFTLRNNTARQNGTYGLFPVRSRRGFIAGNVATDTRSDACIYVGQSEQVLVRNNTASGCVIGLQMENCRHVVMRDNEAFDNTTGIIVDVIDARQVTVASDDRVVRNFVHDNNRPNPAPPDSDTGALQAGIGIVVDSADRTLVARNRIQGHHLAGITFVNFCVGRPNCGPPPDIDPYPDHDRFLGNRFRRNRTDLIWLPGAGKNNCLAPTRHVTVSPPAPACGR